MSLVIENLLETLRCPGCQGELSSSHTEPMGFACLKCDEKFPVTNSIPRMLLRRMREALAGEAPTANADQRQVRTAQSFGYEWTRFPEMYAQWEQSFLDYMQPH